MPRPDDVVAYTYKADLYCPEDALARAWEGQAPLGVSVEQALGVLAHAKGIDWEDERTFDSGDFPKVVFRDQLEPGDCCGACGRLLGADVDSVRLAAESDVRWGMH